MTKYNLNSVPAAIGGYSQAVEVHPNARYLFISGQIPEMTNGEVPALFEEQCRIVWQNITAVLESAGMSVQNLVKVTTYLTHVDQIETNSKIRRMVLADCSPALTVIIAQTLNSKWLLEIEAVAAKVD